MSKYNKKYLLKMLSYRRPHNSHSEKNFINNFIKPHADFIDENGNLFTFVDGAQDKAMNENNEWILPSILFTAHTDTVHCFGGKQQVNIHAEIVNNKIHDFATVKDDVLGADCGSGCFILLAMIEHYKKNPPLHNMTFVFFRNEESGGVGSSAALKTDNKSLKTLLQGIDKVISFDRKGYNDIINIQNGSQCCSDQFITENGFDSHFGYKAARGSFTDSANFTDQFSNSGFKECTNLSIGYFDQHTKKEKQDLTFLVDILLPKLLTFNWDNLKVFRKYDEYQVDEYDFYNYQNFLTDPTLNNYVRYNTDKVYNFINDFGLVDELVAAYGAEFLESQGFTLSEVKGYYGDNRE